MANGVPYDVAFALPPLERAAQSIIFRQFQGAKFNYDRMEFEEER